MVVLWAKLNVWLNQTQKEIKEMNAPKMMNFVDNSPKMLEPVITRKPQKSKVPFEQIPVGKSLIIPFDEATESTLRVLVSAANKNLKPKRFKCVKHSEHNVFEIGRLEDFVEPVQEQPQTEQTWIEPSPQMGGNDEA